MGDPSSSLTKKKMCNYIIVHFSCDPVSLIIILTKFSICTENSTRDPPFITHLFWGL